MKLTRLAALLGLGLSSRTGRRLVGRNAGKIAVATLALGLLKAKKAQPASTAARLFDRAAGRSSTGPSRRRS